MTNVDAISLRIDTYDRVHHVAIMRQGDVTQCLWCGYWTRGEETLLNRHPCIEPSDAEDDDLSSMEVTA